jgi:hypothetical protein
LAKIGLELLKSNADKTINDVFQHVKQQTYIYEITVDNELVQKSQTIGEFIIEKNVELQFKLEILDAVKKSEDLINIDQYIPSPFGSGSFRLMPESDAKAIREFLGPDALKLRPLNILEIPFGKATVDTIDVTKVFEKDYFKTLRTYQSYADAFNIAFKVAKDKATETCIKIAEDARKTESTIT